MRWGRREFDEGVEGCLLNGLRLALQQNHQALEHRLTSLPATQRTCHVTMSWVNYIDKAIIVRSAALHLSQHLPRRLSVGCHVAERRQRIQQQIVAFVVKGLSE